MGLVQGPGYPAMNVMIAKWTPLEERGFLVAFLWSGGEVGTTLALILSGYLSDELSWESCFYVFGALGILWFVFWSFLVFDSPDSHPSISSEERDYISAHLPPVKVDKLPAPPFRHFLLQPCFWAIVIAHIGSTWGVYTAQTEIPTYLANVQHFSITAVICSTKNVCNTLLRITIFLERLFLSRTLCLIRRYGCDVRSPLRLPHPHEKAFFDQLQKSVPRI